MSGRTTWPSPPGLERGGDGDRSNAANWSCVNAADEPVANGVPDADSRIVLTGLLGVDFPEAADSYASVSVTGTVVLTRACDWRGLGDIEMPLGAKIDLAGYRLDLPTAQKVQLRPVAYIESTGAQVIDTGVVPGPTTSLDIDFTTTEYAGEATLFGTLNWNRNEYILTLRADRGKQEFCWFGDYQFATFYANRHLRLIVDSTNGALTFFDGETGDELEKIVTTAFNCNCGKPLTIFGQGNGTKAGKYRIHGFKITKDGTLVRDFVPVRGVRTDRAGLYDKVTGAFYAANGLKTGADVAGDWYDIGTQAARLVTTGAAGSPEGYSPADYIESTGAQVILTGIVPDATTSLDVDFTTFDYAVESTLFATQGWNQHMYMLTLRNDHKVPEFCWFGDYKFATFYTNRHMRLTVDPTKGALTFTDPDTAAELAKIATTDFLCNSGSPLSIFGQNDGTKAGKYRIYGFKMTKAGALVRDFVPAWSLTEQRYGLYDKVSGAFFGANGLLSGPPVDAESTATPGTLGFTVPEGISYTPGFVALTGNLSVEKNGKGDFRFGTALAATGVTRVNGGTLAPAASGGSALLGPLGNRVFIGKDGTFDIRGVVNLGDYLFTVAGGRMTNSGTGTAVSGIGKTVSCVGSVTLTADATFDVPSAWGLVAAGDGAARLDLGGHTLTVETTAMFLLFNTTVSNGRLVLTGTGQAWVGGTEDLHAESAEIVHACAGLPLAHDVRVRDFTDESANAVGVGGGVIRVTGRYAALTDAYRACEMADGVTIDLSARTTALATASTATGLAGQTLSFAEGASVTLALGARKVSSDERILAWDTAPANLKTLSFRATSTRPRVNYRTVVRADGVYAVSEYTLFIIR